MTPASHADEARTLLDRAMQESQDGGNDIVAALCFWGAFVHCMIAVAQQEGLPHFGPRHLRQMARHMDTAQGSSIWRTRFVQAEQLDKYRYDRHLQAQILKSYQARTIEAVTELLAILERIGVGSTGPNIADSATSDDLAQ